MGYFLFGVWAVGFTVYWARMRYHNGPFPTWREGVFLLVIAVWPLLVLSRGVYDLWDATGPD